MRSIVETAGRIAHVGASVRDDRAGIDDERNRIGHTGVPRVDCIQNAGRNGGALAFGQLAAARHIPRRRRRKVRRPPAQPERIPREVCRFVRAHDHVAVRADDERGRRPIAKPLRQVRDDAIFQSVQPSRFMFHPSRAVDLEPILPRRIDDVFRTEPEPGPVGNAVDREATGNALDRDDGMLWTEIDVGMHQHRRPQNAGELARIDGDLLGLKRSDETIWTDVRQRREARAADDGAGPAPQIVEARIARDLLAIHRVERREPLR